VPYLLDNRLAPLTFSWSFLQAPLDRVLGSYTRWQRVILHRVRATDVDRDLEQSLGLLEPLDMSCSRVLFQSTRSEWTSVFGNSALGGRPPVAAYMAERLECRAVDCVAIPNSASRRRGNAQPSRGVWGAVELTLHAPHRLGSTNRERTIRVANDVRGWEFQLFGAQQPFEEASSYDAPRKADRFTTEMLERYGRALGLDIFDAAFYSGPGVLTQSTPWLLPRSPSVSLGEARVRLGID
jgi:hypothetical protein